MIGIPNVYHTIGGLVIYFLYFIVIYCIVSSLTRYVYLEAIMRIRNTFFFKENIQTEWIGQFVVAARWYKPFHNAI